MAKQKKKKSGKSHNHVSPYQQAGHILNQVWSISNNSSNNNSNNKSRLKSAVYDASSGSLKCSSSTYAICAKVLQHQATLQSVLEQAGGDSITQDISNEGLFYVLLYELLLGPNKAIRGGGAVKRQILKQEDALRKALADIQKREGVTASDSNNNNNDNHLHPFPRYVRVNTLRTTTSQMVATWRQQQRQQQQQVDSTNQKKKQKIDSNTDCSMFYQDAHVPDLLVFPHNATKALLSSSLSRNHEIVLQDKSSCFPALCLVHGFSDSNNNKSSSCNRVYLDACAAPGNKTSHLAALASSAAAASQKDNDDGDNNTAPIQVYALDRSKDRCVQLKRRMQQLSPDTIDKVQIHAQCRDFLSLGRHHDDDNRQNGDVSNKKKHHKDQDDSNDKALVEKVTDILLDPSCSGSGIFHRSNESDGDGDPGSNNDDHHHRLQSLSNFQTTALRHALTSFPNVQRVVYSTCSIHHQENEGVVAEVLSDTDLSSLWHLVAPVCLADWKRRGQEPEKRGRRNINNYSSLTKEQMAALIRVDREDETNGFFVACFERKDDASTTTTPKASKMKKKAKLSSSSSTNTFSRVVLADVPVYNGEFKTLMTNTSVKDNSKGRSSSSSIGGKGKQSPTDNKTSSGSAGKKRKPSGARDGSSPPPKQGTRDEQDGDNKMKRKKNKTADNSKSAPPQDPEDESSTKRNKTEGDGEVHVVDHDKPLPKKIAKKLAWKKRQRELKQQRMQSKQRQKS